MIRLIYVEEEIASHERTQRIVAQHPGAQTVAIERYQQVFNPRAQNFRLQKQHPALILAAKRSGRVQDVPNGFGFPTARNVYFSHMLNCIYDCRYCFLQGAFNSANYVLFVNYEDFVLDLKHLAEGSACDIAAFSGYDCDSLALESVSGFVEWCLPQFKQMPNVVLELRTKSVAIAPLLRFEPMPNAVVAFSLTPDAIAKAVEHKAPPLRSRLQAAQKLTRSGWKVGLRFDPLIYEPDFEAMYGALFSEVFQTLAESAIHSVTLGPLRFPSRVFQRIAALYPSERLFAAPLLQRRRGVTYPEEVAQPLHAFCRRQVLQHVSERKLFSCTSGSYV